MTRYKVFVLLLFLSLGFHAKAQFNIDEEFNSYFYNARVKFVSEFFARFNGTEKLQDIDEKYSDRMSNILYLFDLSQFESENDSSFIEAKGFAETIVENDVKINYYDSCWYARVKCEGLLGKKNVSFDLYLIVENRGELMYKWSIADVDGEIFNTSLARSHKLLFLNPNCHEQSFMDLSRITKESSRYIDDYVVKGYESKKLDVFLTLVRSGQLIVSYISDIEFTFHQVPNFIFSVKHFERESMNAGWLINTISKSDEEEKSVFFNRLHHVNLKNIESVIPPIENQDLNIDVSSSDTTELVVDYKSSVIYQKVNNTQDLVVQRFLNIISLWFQTGDADYLKKALSECAGKKGSDCFVADRAISSNVKNVELDSDSILNIKKYLNDVNGILHNKTISITYSNLCQVSEDEDYFQVGCDLCLIGDISSTKKFVFSVRKKDYKINSIISK